MRKDEVGSELGVPERELTLEGYVEYVDHSLKLRASDHAAVFDRFGVRMCQTNPTNEEQPSHTWHH